MAVKLHQPPPTFMLTEMDPLWRAVRVMGDDKTGPAAQLLGSCLVAAYPAVLAGRASNPYLDHHVACRAVARCAVLSSTGGCA